MLSRSWDNLLAVYFPGRYTFMSGQDDMKFGEVKIKLFK